ncbi:MAG: [NiFe] hydrogenase maturation protein HypF, partial [Pseudomonadota bacterium]
MQRLKIKLCGIIQGVGFRPFVVRLANELNLNGFVLNTGGGVSIEIEGQKTDEFCQRLSNEKPKMARIDSIKISSIAVLNSINFEILESNSQNTVGAFLPADFSLCADCENEMRDANSRRFNYAFISCTDCGARYSIIRKMPFDRHNSTMDEFPMCEECLSEYKDPSNRRFHAQTTCCEKCGPKLDGTIFELAQRVKNGEVCGLKGIGGYNLICDARNFKAVQKLREIKKRPLKPLAVMFGDIDTLLQYTQPSEVEKQVLESIEKPIV